LTNEDVGGGVTFTVLNLGFGLLGRWFGSFSSLSLAYIDRKSSV